MNVLIASDKFKGSISASDVCHYLHKGIIKSNPEAQVTTLPLADGGDGTLAVLKDKYSSSDIWLTTLDPLGRKIEAYYTAIENTAYVELAIASGISLLDSHELNPMVTTTTGTGTLLRHALEHYPHVVLALGGSCTTDAGLGICAELGFHFYDKNETLIRHIFLILHQ